jgi:hypothetical protein
MIPATLLVLNTDTTVIYFCRVYYFFFDILELVMLLKYNILSYFCVCIYLFIYLLFIYAICSLY